MESVPMLYAFCWKDSDMELSYDRKDNKERIYQMYQEIFEDPESFAQYYFEEIYQKNQVLMAKKEEKLVGMIHLNPYKLSVREKEFMLHYIVAVAVDPKCRRQGIMAQMLKRVLRDMAKENQPFTYLMPADKAYYEPFDFVFIMDWNEARISGEESPVAGEIVPIKEDKVISEYLKKVMEEYEVYTVPDQAYIDLTRKECLSSKGEWMAWKKDGRIQGIFASGYEDQDVFLRWAFSEKPDEMLAQIRNFYKEREIEITGGNLLKGLQVPKIMCRIISLKAWEEILTCSHDCSFALRVEDPLIDENNQCFQFEYQCGKMHIKTVKEAPDAIAIGELCQVFFGYQAEKILEKHPCLKKIIPIKTVYISEEV